MSYFKYIILILCLFSFSCNQWPQYDVHGATFEFESEEIIVPKYMVKSDVERVADLFEPYLEVNKYKPIDGVIITSTIDRPIIRLAKVINPDDPKEKWKWEYYTQELCGKTWPGRNSYVYHKELLSDGCGMYELRLHYMHYLFPGQSEQKDIDWMKKEGIL